MGLKQDHHRHSKRVTATKRWQVLRHAVLERDGWACKSCGTRKGRLEVDHVQPVRTHPERAFDPAGLQTLCTPCHSSKTRREVGWAPVHSSPERDAWAQAVAELATPTRQREVSNAG